MESGPEAHYGLQADPIWSSGQNSWFSPRWPCFDFRYGNCRLLSASLLKRQVHLTAAEAFFDNSRATET